MTTGNQKNDQNATVTGGQGGNGGRGGDASANQNANFGNNTVNQIQRCLNNNGNGNSSNQYSDQYGNDGTNGTLQYEDTNGSSDTGTSSTPSTSTTSTPDNGGGVVADAGGTNPDTLPPESSPRGPVSNEVPFNEPLPPTGGISPIILLLGAALIVVGAVLALRKIR